MSISKMRKVVIAGHMPECDSLIHELQNTAIIEPVDISENNSSSPDNQQNSFTTLTRENPEIHNRLKEMRKFLEKFKPEEPFFQKVLNPRYIISKSEFNEITTLTNPNEILNKVEELYGRLSSLEKEREDNIIELNLLEPFKEIKINVSETVEIESSNIFFGSADKNKLDKIKPYELADCQVLQENKNGLIVLLAVHRDLINVQDYLFKDILFKEIKLPDLDVSPEERYNTINKRIEEIFDCKNLILKDIESLLTEFKKITILLEYHSNLERRSRVFDLWFTMENSFIINGWIREKDVDKLEDLISKFDSVVYEDIDAGDEKPPIALENSKLFSPFQLITRLYNFPDYNGVDPSAVTSIFFAIFFGLALTDAGYGLILAIIALFGIFRFRGNREILWIVFWGGIFTVFAGILTGGIFGDLFRTEEPFINIPVLGEIRETLMWFDPMKNPMTFFRLVLFLGTVHVVIGLIVGLVSNIRQRKIADAVVGNFTWIVIVASLLTMLFSTTMSIDMSLIEAESPPLGPEVFFPAVVALLSAGFVVIGFSARNEKSLFFRFFVGFLKLFVLSGIFSYLGDILSYIRLMALGMVTAGIGMAINTIAFMMYDIPVAGVVLTVFVLIFGHIFNLAINMLGGFVHTLRLQYVEFFSKFFVGGGREFVPLSNSEKYVKIIY